MTDVFLYDSFFFFAVLYAGRYPDSYWIVTRVKMTQTSKRAWGKLVWKGEVRLSPLRHVCMYACTYVCYV